MAKIFTYIFLIVGLMLLFRAAGIIGESGIMLGTYELHRAGNLTVSSGLANLKASDFWSFSIGKIIQLLTVTGVIIGVWIAKSPYQALSAGLASGILIKFIGDLVIIMDKINTGSGALSGQYSWVGWIALLIMAPIIFGYVIALWEWIGGRD